MRFDERYDEFGYERDDDDYEEQINEFLTPREVMELLAIGKNTFYKMVQSGQLPAFRIGRQWRVRRGRLEELWATSPSEHPGGAEPFEPSIAA